MHAAVTVMHTICVGVWELCGCVDRYSRRAQYTVYGEPRPGFVAASARRCHYRFCSARRRPAPPEGHMDFVCVVVVGEGVINGQRYVLRFDPQPGFVA